MSATPVSTQLKPHDTCFKVFRIYALINASLMYTMVFFHRTCPSIVSDDMAVDYDVEKSKLGVFSSIFFYPYAVMQIFAGLLTDIFDPAILIGISQIVSSIGGLICGLSKNIPVGSVGRFFVGLGCGPTYVPICKFVANWFPLSIYSNMLGVILVFGAVGGILAQYPLASFADKFGWRVSFYGISGLSFILSILLIIFCRGKPEDRGYEPVNKIASVDDKSCKEKFLQLCRNFLVVVKFGYFWLCAGFIFLKDGPYFDITGLWGGPYLADIYGMGSGKKGITLVGASIGLIIGSFGFPVLSKVLKTRKWICCVSLGLISIVFLIMILVGHKIPYGLLYFFFILIGICLCSTACLIFALVRDYFDPSIAGTSIGIANFFAFIATAIYQTISSEVIPKAGKEENEDGADIYLEKGYRDGLWILCLVSSALSAVCAGFAKDDYKAKLENEEKKESIAEEKKANEGEKGDVVVVLKENEKDTKKNCDNSSRVALEEKENK